MDKLTPEHRSENMRRIKSKNTSPELAVRSLLHVMGYRFRLHARELPGKPDIVFRRRKKAILVHGCFWHGHDAGCADSRRPKSNRRYWNPKITGNKERDARNLAVLRKEGWQVLVVWDCQIQDTPKLRRLLERFMATEK
jgi:DNA mismatch endonuclease, patch repair protein